MEDVEKSVDDVQVVDELMEVSHVVVEDVDKYVLLSHVVVQEVEL